MRSPTATGDVTSTAIATTTAAHAEALDAGDELASFRDRFVVHDPGLVYLDGNSLGRLPLATLARLRETADEGWGRRLVRGWDDWLELPERVGDLIGRTVVGARPGEVVVSDSTTVNLYKLAHAALEARADRHVIVTDRDNFPTDRYVLEGLARTRGLAIRWLDSDPVDGPQAVDVAAALDTDVALVSLSLVNYRSAAIADIAAITSLAHEAGALTLWDLSHAAGSIPIDLEASDADLAVGCTYKYLIGGPGAPAFLYVRRRLQGELRNPIQGWFGQRDQFAMGPVYDPEPGIRAWLTGTPTILAVAGVEESVRLVGEAGIEAIRAKGIALTEYAIALHDAWLGPLGFRLGSPREAGRRGAHVAVRHPDARRYNDELIDAGVIPDFREPDSIRLGLSPLTTSFADVRRGLERLREIAAR
jgi:kynureninase